MATSIGERFLSTAGRYGDKTAVVDSQRTLSYREYAGAALAVAGEIERRGAGERVALMLPTTWAFSATFMGVGLSGRVPVPLNFLLAPEELSYIISNCGARMVVASRVFEKSLSGLDAEVAYVEEFLPEAIAAGPAQPKPANAVAAILYTSGTTGVPKGVVLSQRNIVTNADACVAHFAFTPEDVLFGVLPLFHSFALTTTLVVPALIGATSVLMARFEPGAVVEAIARHRVTATLAVPSMYRALLRSLDNSEDFSTLRLPVCGGEALAEEVFQAYRDKLGITLYEGYGLTETSPAVSANTPSANKPLTVGRPLPGVEVRVVDESGEDAGINADGEILVRGESVMEGYLGLPEETRRTITWNGFLRTGDIGRIDSDGFLRITGRKKEMIISAGENIFPREIEVAIARHPAVAEVAVIGIPDRMRGEAPKAFVVLKEGAAATEEELKEFCGRCIARFKVPAEVEFRGSFPHSPTGKILKQRLVGRGGAGPGGGS